MSEEERTNSTIRSEATEESIGGGRGERRGKEEEEEMMMKLPDYGDGSERGVHGDEGETGTGTGSDLDRHIGKRMGMESQVRI